MENKEIKELTNALISAQSEFTAIPFDTENLYYKSKYASLGVIIEKTRPILKKHGLAITQLIRNDAAVPEVVAVETVLLHTSGQFLSSVVSVLIPDAKNYIQELGKVTTYLRRYCYSAMLGLYADEDNDGNDVGGQPNDKKQPAAAGNKQPEPEKIERPYNPTQLKEALAKMTKFVKPASEKQISLLASLLSGECTTDDERHRLQKFLFGEESLSKVDPLLITAAIKWLDPIKEGRDYTINEIAITELVDVLEMLETE